MLSEEQIKEVLEKAAKREAEAAALGQFDKPWAALHSVDYARYRQTGSSHEEALIKAEELRLRNIEYRNTMPAYKGDGVQVGPRGGRYRINSKGRKAYDV